MVLQRVSSCVPFFSELTDWSYTEDNHMQQCAIKVYATECAKKSSLQIIFTYRRSSYSGQVSGVLKEPIKQLSSK